jgi:hypothetical protein
VLALGILDIGVMPEAPAVARQAAKRLGPID